ncbi:SRPBCC family protein [Streptomyces albicerus]|uniref:SRPBCC family protein n=1 Tax=Streptomyces albicerus TaxID=2569859 RepID=UPI00124BB6DA|nr:SRPBCC family protein [Streptomyces albicerus]
MSPLISTIEITRPPGEVFSYITDPTRFTEWQGDVVRVRTEKDGPHDVGARFTTTRRIGRTERTMTQEVTEFDSPAHWAVRGLDGPLRPAMDITVEPLAEGTRSRVTFALDFAPQGIGVPLLPLVRRRARKGAPISYRKLKKRLEGSSVG